MSSRTTLEATPLIMQRKTPMYQILSSFEEGCPVMGQNGFDRRNF